MRASGREQRELPVMAVVSLCAGFAVIVVLSLWSMRELLVRLEPGLGDRIVLEHPGLGPTPPDPKAGLQELRTREEDMLTHYNWVSKENGLVRIPIDVAMDLVLQRGLPVRGKAATTQPDTTEGSPRDEK